MNNRFAKKLSILMFAVLATVPVVQGMNEDKPAAKRRRGIMNSYLLLEAAAEGDLRLVHTLLRKGAHTHATNLCGSTPLHLAARSGRIEVVRALLRGGARSDVRDNRGRLPLHLSVVLGHGAVTGLLLMHNSLVVDAKDNDNNTALRLACIYHPAIVRLLMTAGADAEAPVLLHRNRTYLQEVACEYDICSLGAVRALLTGGASMSESSYGFRWFTTSRLRP